MTSKKKTIIIASVICGLLAFFILLAVLIGFLFFAFLFNKKVFSSSSVSATSSFDHSSVSTETSQDAFPEVSVEDPDVIPEPIVWASNEVYGEAYKELLSLKSYSIANYYYWQFNYEILDYYPYYNKLGDNPCIALSELTGDNIPELLLVTVPNYQGTEAEMSFFTVEENKAEKIYTINVDSIINGENDYILFKNYRGELYLYTESRSDDTLCKYTHIYRNDSGKFVAKAECLKKSISNPHTSDITTEYYANDNYVSEEEYENCISQITQKGITALLYDSLINSSSEAWIVEAQREALIYGDAISLLTRRENVPEGELPIYAPIQMTFASGAGGWGTYLELNPDGTFSANFYDSDMGDTGVGYDNGTVYCGSCSGTFTNIKKIDEYTYSMTLSSYTEEVSGEPYIEDSTLWVPSETYGIDCGEIIFCLPGKPISELHEDALFWGYAFYSDIANKDKLPCFMFYNTETGYAFFN